MDAAAEVLRLIFGYRTSQAIYVAAMVGLSDQLVDGPRTVPDLAKATECDPAALRRLLRLLVAIGLYSELPDGRIASTPMGDQLRNDVDAAVGSFAKLAGAPYHWSAWGALLHSVRTGENAFTSVHGQSVWDYRLQHPDEGAVFDAAMTAYSLQVADAVVEAYDFGAFGVITDVAGGRGGMMAAILNSDPRPRGVLFDQPHVVDGAPALLERAGVADRCEIVAGDMFTAVPAGADAYVLKAVIHDWRNNEAVAIMSSCRRAMAPGAALLIIERLIGGSADPSEATRTAISDLNMLVGPDGQERTRAEYEALLTEAGLSLTRVVPTSSDVYVIEARA